jgi:hypothetical protein
VPIPTTLAALAVGVLPLIAACGAAGSATAPVTTAAVSGRFVALPNSAGGHPVDFRFSVDGDFHPGLTVVDPAEHGDPSNCTLGWPITSDTGQRGYLTAGHCATGFGHPTWVFTDRNARNRRYLGPYTEHEDDTLSDGTMFDAAATFLPAGTAGWTDSIAGRDIAGSLSPTQVTALPSGTPICMLGARSGLTCGPLIRADHRFLEWGGYAVVGDSGSALFTVLADGSVCGVGILHDGPTDRDNTVAYLAPVLQRWRLNLPVTVGGTC